MIKKVFIATITIGSLLAPIRTNAEIIQVVPLSLIPPVKVVKVVDIEIVGVNKEVASLMVNAQYEEATYEDLKLLVHDVYENYKETPTETSLKVSRISNSPQEFSKSSDSLDSTVVAYNYANKILKTEGKTLTNRDVIQVYQLLLEDKSIFLNEYMDIKSIIDVEDDKMGKSLTKQELIEYHKSFMVNLKLNTNKEKQMYTKLVK